ncbi:hypothetical protein V2A60_008061 [Cordyceps javanica]
MEDGRDVATTFAFVNDQSPHDSRSHAMREHWKKRRQKKSADLPSSSSSSALSTPLPLQPRVKQGSSISSGGGGGGSSPGGGSKRRSTSKSPKKIESSWDEPGIPAQALSGLNLALGACRLDPFDQFPVKLTAQHHKLLLHWFNIYAAMTFDSSSKAKFNPLRDVFFPLDLSNAASFNAVMAQSAAHLARMQGRLRSTEALQFKAEAIRILSVWMADDKLATSDDVLGAISRILAYERYWGTEAEWLVHRAGLQRLIDQRGGVQSLQNNWRLEITIYLISLMSKPSWFDSSNQLWEICDTSMSAHLAPILGNHDALPRVRSLWLISFIQDTRTLMNNRLDLYSSGISNYSALQATVVLLYDALPAKSESAGTHKSSDQSEYVRLSCILFIVLIIQASASSPASEEFAQRPSSSQTAELDAFLKEHEPEWTRSVQGLYNTLSHKFSGQGTFSNSSNYALHMAKVIGFMSQETRRGLELTLLNLLPHVPAMGRQIENDWTPDALLSSIHGD